MNTDTLEQILQEAFEGAKLQVQSPDNVHFDVVLVSEQFVDLSRLLRQKLVYKILDPYLADGRIHALGLKTLTFDEWSSIQQG